MECVLANLVSPFVDNRHVDIINKHRHLFASGRAVRVAHSLVHVALNRPLEHQWCGRRGEVKALTQMPFRIVFTHVPLDHDCLSCALLAD